MKWSPTSGCTSCGPFVQMEGVSHGVEKWLLAHVEYLPLIVQEENLFPIPES